METFYDKKIEGTIIRSRARWHEYGEKSNKYFLSLEKRNNVRKHVRKLCLSGVITTDRKKVLEASSDFYKNLYSSQGNVSQNDDLNMFLRNSNNPRLSEEQKASCAGRILKEECKRALESFDPGKTHNFEERPNQIQKTVNLWSMRGLSLFGEVTIIKTFLIPKMLHVSSIIETPYDILRRMERMIYKFLWKGPDRVTRNLVINTLEQGGLNLTDIETQIKALRLFQ